MHRFALAAALAAAVSPASGDGAKVFAENCAICHQANGRGITGVYPPLAGQVGRYVQVPEGRAYLARVVAYGLFGPIRAEGRPYNGFMPSHPNFTGEQIASVIDYVLTELNANELPPDYKPLTPEEVARYLEGQKPTPSQLREERAAMLERLERAGAEKSKQQSAIPKITGTLEDYSRECQGCHRADGMGAPGAVPRLRDFVGYFTHLPEGREYLMRVPGVAGAYLDDTELAALLNWMLRTFSAEQLAPGFEPYTPDEVARYRRHPIPAVQARREALIAELQSRGLLEPDEDGLGVSPERR
ncbi:MAG: cytochrome c [Gammaproteobacteria bacterium]|nr:cytochrome c [Gammaproteobacteria bacterium]NIU06760.1 cytochrome c [Gammaproteobacteria bacterium]NIV53693.1 c-type cytochrome [Gammaproteobacteria bacterium]NIX88033.1 c-type cytochrome [Gammaproteobacteria bacterium]